MFTCGKYAYPLRNGQHFFGCGWDLLERTGKVTTKQYLETHFSSILSGMNLFSLLFHGEDYKINQMCVAPGGVID